MYGIGMFDAMRWQSQLAVRTIKARSGVVMQDELIACDRLRAISTHSRGSSVVRATCLRALGASRPPSLQTCLSCFPSCGAEVETAEWLAKERTMGSMADGGGG